MEDGRHEPLVLKNPLPGEEEGVQAPLPRGGGKVGGF